jgi:hypothetical protein
MEAYFNSQFPPKMNWQLPVAQRNVFRSDIGIVQEKIKLCITAKGAKTVDAHWGRWGQTIMGECTQLVQIVFTLIPRGI